MGWGRKIPPSDIYNDIIITEPRWTGDALPAAILIVKHVIEYLTRVSPKWDPKSSLSKARQMNRTSAGAFDIEPEVGDQLSITGKDNEYKHEFPLIGSARLRYAMLCYAMLCYAMLCYAMLCYAMLCYAMLCYARK